MMSQGDDVQTGVLNALYWDLAVPRLRVKVEVENRWVTISGMVERPYQRTCAESDARNSWRGRRHQSNSARAGAGGLATVKSALRRARFSGFTHAV
jgi:hypothetical protein